RPGHETPRLLQDRCAAVDALGALDVEGIVSQRPVVGDDFTEHPGAGTGFDDAIGHRRADDEDHADAEAPGAVAVGLRHAENTAGTSQEARDICATSPCGSTRATLADSPPPVTWETECTAVGRASKSAASSPV